MYSNREQTAHLVAREAVADGELGRAGSRSVVLIFPPASSSHMAWPGSCCKSHLNVKFYHPVHHGWFALIFFKLHLIKIFGAPFYIAS